MDRIALVTVRHDSMKSTKIKKVKFLHFLAKWVLLNIQDQKICLKLLEEIKTL